MNKENMKRDRAAKSTLKSVQLQYFGKQKAEMAIVHRRLPRTEHTEAAGVTRRGMCKEESRENRSYFESPSMQQCTLKPTPDIENCQQIPAHKGWGKRVVFCSVTLTGKVWGLRCTGTQRAGWTMRLNYIAPTLHQYFTNNEMNSLVNQKFSIGHYVTWKLSFRERISIIEVKEL